jgi:hypothetical protein
MSDIGKPQDSKSTIGQVQAANAAKDSLRANADAAVRKTAEAVQQGGRSTGDALRQGAEVTADVTRSGGEAGPRRCAAPPTPPARRCAGTRRRWPTASARSCRTRRRSSRR